MEYRKRYGSAHNRTSIPNRVGIEEHPAVANNRERVGDWEADTIIGKNHKGAIATLDERKTKLRLAVPLPGKKAKAVKQGMIGVLKPLKKFVKTITYDNGNKFVQHDKHPYRGDALVRSASYPLNLDLYEDTKITISNSQAAPRRLLDQCNLPGQPPESRSHRLS